MAIDKYKLKDGSTRYRVSVYINGQRVAQKRGFETKKAAKDYEASIRIKEDYEKAPTYENIEQLYLRSIENTLQGSSVYYIERTLKVNIPESWRKKDISTIKPVDAQKLVNTLTSKCKSGRGYISRISCLFEFAKKMGYISTNPFDMVQKPKIVKSDPDERWALWTPEQFAIFLEEAKKYDSPYAYPLFRLYLFSGMRHGEPLGLLWTDFDYENRTINLQSADGLGRHGERVLKSPKNDSKRKIVLDQVTADSIEDLRQGSISDRIFPVGYYSVQTWFTTIERRAKLPHSRLHNFRVEHCNVLLSNGAYVKDVQQRVGHKNAQTTLNVYARANRNSDEVLDYIPENHYTTHYKEE